jgi:starch phosphorylase
MSAISVPLYQSKLTFPSTTATAAAAAASPSSAFFVSTNKLSFSTALLHVTSHITSRTLASTNQSLSTITTATIEINNNDLSDPHTTAIVIRARNRIGLLQVITRVFKILGLRIEKATVEFDEGGGGGGGECFIKTFYVSDSHGNRIEDDQSLEKIKKALFDAIDGGAGEVKVGSSSSTGKGVVVRRSGGLRGGETRVGVERMFGLMDRFLKSDPSSLQKDILDHVEYTVARSRFSFDDFEAYQVIN